MGTRTRIAVATRSPSERAAFTDWLNSAGFDAVPVRDVGASTRDIEALHFEMLLADFELINVGALMHVARYRAIPGRQRLMRSASALSHPDPPGRCNRD